MRAAVAMRVVVVCTEQGLCDRLLRMLTAVDGVEAVATSSTDAAAAALRAGDAKLALCDLDSVDEAARLLTPATNPHAVPVAFLTRNVPTARAELPPDTPLIRQPVEPHVLRELVRIHVEPAPAPEDYLFRIADYVQLCCLGQHSVELSANLDGTRIGHMLIVGGEIWSATDSVGTGDDAVLRLADLRAHIRCRPIDQRKLQRNVDTSWQRLLLRAATESDERRVRAAEPVAAPPESTAVQQILDRGIEALVCKDFARAAMAFAAVIEIEPNNRMALANLERLNELGLASRKDA